MREQGSWGQEIFCSPPKYHPYPDQATEHRVKVLPHQSLLLRHWRASVSPSSGLEKGLNSLRARRSISSSSSHSGEPKVSTAGNELAVLEGDSKRHPGGQRHTHRALPSLSLISVQPHTQGERPGGCTDRSYTFLALTFLLFIAVPTSGTYWHLGVI